ncbi:MAG TPA: hypothetical protein VF753_20850 [Terriglobales bacterium]
MAQRLRIESDFVEQIAIVRHVSSAVLEHFPEVCDLKIVDPFYIPMLGLLEQIQGAAVQSNAAKLE